MEQVNGGGEGWDGEEGAGPPRAGTFRMSVFYAKGWLRPLLTQIPSGIFDRISVLRSSLRPSTTNVPSPIA